MAHGRRRARWRVRRHYAAVVAALVLVGTAAPARGQLPQPPPPFQPPMLQPETDVVVPIPPAEDPRRFRLGARVRLDAEYNDNVFRTERATRDELREGLTPTVTFRLVARDLQLGITYAPSLVHSSVIDEDVVLFHTADAAATYAVTERLTLGVTDRFVLDDDPAISDPRGTRRGRATLSQNTLTTDLAYRREPWSITPRYSLTTTRTEREGQAEAPAEERSTVHALGADATLDVARRTTLGAGYELTLADFQPGQDFVGHRGRASVSRALDPVTDASLRGSVIHRDVRGGSDFDIYRGDVGVRRDVGPSYSIETRVGYGAFEPARGAGEQMAEFLVRGIYSGRPVRITASAAQAFQETFLEAENVGVTRTREGAVEVRYDSTDRLAVVLQARVAENRFLQPSTAPITPVAQRELLVGAGVAVEVRLARRLWLGVGYDFTRVDADRRGFDYEQNRARVGITAVYD